MKITLRKANALQNSINDAIKQISVKTSISINEFEDPNQKVMTANKELFANDQRRSDLLMAQFNVRGLVGAANATSGVDAKLTQSAYIDKRLSQLTDLASAQPQAAMSVIMGKLDKIKSRPADSRASLYGREDDVDTGIMTDEQIKSVNALIKDLKKQKQKLNDEILELNVRTEIEMDAEVVAILQRENLV